ncbi:MAG: NADPH-dependent F420 reductase [Halococcoides sp.]
MTIAILGGTGDIGEGLTLRFARDTDHRVIVGSRDPDRAAERAATYRSQLDKRGRAADIEGLANAAAAAAASIVVAAVPPYHLRETIQAVADGLDEETILVTPAVGMSRDDAGMHYDRPGAGSVTELAATAAPDEVAVVGAAHTLPAARLADLDAELGIDTVLVGPAEPKATVAELFEAVEGLRPVDAGPLANAAEIEAVTPLLINVAQNTDGLDQLGVRFQ